MSGVIYFMKATELKKQGKFIYRYKPVVFNGGPTVGAPMRENDEIDGFDKVFDSQADFEVWYRDLVAGFAELDECLNYCQYFVREKGNEGHYVRDGKSYPVNGTWTGYEMNCDFMAGFKHFLIENDFYTDWFKLHERYENNL